MSLAKYITQFGQKVLYLNFTLNILHYTILLTSYGIAELGSTEEHWKRQDAANVIAQVKLCSLRIPQALTCFKFVP